MDPLPVSQVRGLLVSNSPRCQGDRRKLGRRDLVSWSANSGSFVGDSPWCSAPAPRPTDTRMPAGVGEGRPPSVGEDRSGAPVVFSAPVDRQAARVEPAQKTASPTPLTERLRRSEGRRPETESRPGAPVPSATAGYPQVA